MRIEKYINGNWYLAQKPYRQMGASDQYYLGICRDLYRLIEGIAQRNPPALPLDEAELRWLAYVYTAYFEDRVSGIGFWDSLVALNRKQFGKRLPFFGSGLLAQQEAEAEDILPADIHYLGYVMLVDTGATGRERPAQPFNHPFLLEMADNVFAYLDRQEEVLVTEVYTDFLTPPSDYYEFRDRFLWFAYKGYLCAEWYNALNDDFALSLGPDDDDQLALREMIEIQECERIAFEEASSCSGFFAIDLFAGALRCPPEERRAIAELKMRPTGVFELKAQGRQYRLRHTATSEIFLVEADDFGPFSELSNAQFLRLTLVPWKGRWFLSGGAMEIPCRRQDLPAINEEGQRYYQKHYAPYRKRVEDFAEALRKEALEFFRSELVEYPDGPALQKAMHNYDEWLAKRKRGKPVYTNLDPDFLLEKGLALCLLPNDAMGFVPGHSALLALLRDPSPDLGGEPLEDALFLLGDPGTGAAYWLLLRRHYALPGLATLLGLSLESDADYEAMLRLHFPWDFSPLKLPELSIVGEGRWS